MDFKGRDMNVLTHTGKWLSAFNNDQKEQSIIELRLTD